MFIYDAYTHVYTKDITFHKICYTIIAFDNLKGRNMNVNILIL